MKILLVHNDYGKYSGEEAVVDKMDVMFRSLGYEVSQLRKSTADSRENLKGKIKGFISGIYCPSGVKAMRDAIRKEKPDVVNIHNLYPFISPVALRECKKADIPVIMTVHNYRLICPTGLFMRNNEPCEVCLDKGNEWGCLRYNCEGSVLKSLGYAARNAVARIRKDYQECVDVFVCLTEFQKRKLIEAGFPEKKIKVIPNSIPVSAISNNFQPPTTNNQPYIGYSGRISKEKGVDLIIEVARKHPEIRFKFAGAVREGILVENLPDNIELMGYLKGEELENFYKNASFFVMASKWYEGFPMTILETARYHKPMVAPDHGGFTEIITSHNSQDQTSENIGMLFDPNDTDSFERAILKMWNNPEETSRLGDDAFNKLLANFSTEVVTKQWDALLKEVTRISTQN